ncbi:AAA family ATPase [Schlesneria sp. T3-172]|uniref:AAA family ATPase n=1 Tax=Schlesneria sphaerica TaxID=3373610 RepID=UPI0037C9A377
MSLVNLLSDYINAAFSGIWVQTVEPEEAERELTDHARAQQWKVITWDIARGMKFPGDPNATAPELNDPLAVLRALPSMGSTGDQNPQTTLLVLPNFHRFLNGIEIVQTLFDLLLTGKQRRLFVVVLSPVVQIPLELERSFIIIEHALPTPEQLSQIATELLADQPDIRPTGTAWQGLLEAASGLTRAEAEGAFALSLARHDRLHPEEIWDLKAQTLKKQNLLTLHRGQEHFARLGGLTALKDFCVRALQPGRKVKPRGTLLLSPPGCGKSVFCRALGNETGRPVLTLDIGALLGGLVGQTEQNVRQSLKIADAMSPCILFCDELEKGLSGVGGTGDSGVSTRLFGTLLTWLADHQSDVFFVGTANDISRLPPEFTRAERLDAVFFIDLPGDAERQMIWDIYRREYDVAPNQPIPADTNWSGAEIKSCARLSALLDIPLSEAAQLIVPVAQTAAEVVSRLRQWASGRCLSADQTGLYQYTLASTAGTRRKVKHDPSKN